ncbi:S-adenosyl-L-methionine-dependent methyltransferase [Phytophthora cactorum]|nr:S-adenosyl-L-methionine-dependent methyltransferase [Phytophthora cactorum]
MRAFWRRDGATAFNTGVKTITMLLWIKGSAAQRLVGHETRRLAESSDSYNFMFYFVIGAMMLTCLIYNIFFKHKMEANFLRQQALPETMLRQDVIASDQDMNNLWECEVCSFKSYDAHTTCMLCGTDRSFKMIEKTTRAIDESSSEHSNAPSSASSSTKYVLYMDEKENPLTRSAVNRATPSRSIGSKSTPKINREFFKRKLSVLNLRQQSARRRHEWSRQRNDDGELIWVRKKHYMDRKALKSLRNLDSLRSQSSASLRDSILSNGSVHSVGIVSRIVVSPKNPTGRLSLEAADGALAMRGSDSSEFSQDELEQVGSLPFQQKHAWFVQHTAAMEVPWEYGHLLLEIERDNLLHNSCEQLLWATPDQLHQSLRIKFANEPGVDAGGLVREWFTLMTKEVFDDTTGLFYRSGNGDGLMINPASAEASVDHLMYYQAIGRFIGRALFEGILIDAHLALPVCKHILGIPITFSDLEFVDNDLYKNLKWLRDNTGVESLALDFTVNVDQMSDKAKVADLVPNGSNIPVTDENKMEYITLRFKWIVATSISQQLGSVMQGLFSIIPKELLSVFDHQELELLICGIPDIDVMDWKTHTIYVGERDERAIAWFWNIVHEFSNEQKARLLQFTTGSARVPVQGFKALTMNDGRICPFAIQCVSADECLYPRAHTCFNRYVCVLSGARRHWRVPELPSTTSRDDGAVEIMDLGAGTGNMGPSFFKRWPKAHVTFVDSSASMLERAKQEHSVNDNVKSEQCTYVEADFESFQPAKPVDLIFSNAALHWVSSERHKQLLPRGHWDRVAHVRWVTCERDLGFYYELFKSIDKDVELDMWATVYAQVLEGDNPVADFVGSTGLRPFMEALNDPSTAATEFEHKYRELIAAAYPRQSDGRTIFNFKRFFARKKSDLVFTKGQQLRLNRPTGARMGPKKGKGKKEKKKGKGGGASKKGAAEVNDAERENEAERLELVKQAKALLELTRKEEQAFNEFQQQREKINYFWIVEKKNFEDRKAELRNKERERQDLEEKHQVEIKVYKQRVKHLLYEHQNEITKLKKEMEQSLKLSQDDYRGNERELKTDKRRLKFDLKEIELSHQDYLKSLKQEQDRRITVLRQEFERHAKELQQKYERKRKAFRDDLEARRKQDTQKIEERKNLHIAQLMTAHEKAFGEIKNYYNDITHNNLDLIKSLKEEVSEMKKKEAQDEKLMFEISQENKRMSEPLKRALLDVEKLRKNICVYQEEKVELRTAKAQLLVLEQEYATLSWEFEVLQQRAAQVARELEELTTQFHSSIYDVQQKAGLKNLLLEKKMGALTLQLEQKDAELNEVLLHAKLDPAIVDRVKGRLEDIMANKAEDLRELEAEMAQVRKLQQELVTAMQLKMSEYGLPLDELGFMPQTRSAVESSKNNSNNNRSYSDDVAPSPGASIKEQQMAQKRAKTNMAKSFSDPAKVQ